MKEVRRKGGAFWCEGKCLWVSALALALISHVKISSFLNGLNRIQRRSIGNLYNQGVKMLCLVVRLWMIFGLVWFCFVFSVFFFFSKFYALGMNSFSIYCPSQAQYLFKCENLKQKKVEIISSSSYLAELWASHETIYKRALWKMKSNHIIQSCWQVIASRLDLALKI